MFSEFQIGKGIWKLNNSLLSNLGYIDLIKKAVLDEKLKYALPVYSINFIESTVSDEHLNFTVDDDTFLELLYLRIRGESVKFASGLKKNRDNKEKALIKDIEILEQGQSHNYQIIDDKKQELENLREHKMKGHFIRSRLKWLNEGEKPTKFFCSLEKRNYTEKTIRKLEISDGTLITDQFKILNEIRKFYIQLFKARPEYGNTEFELQKILQNRKNKFLKDNNTGQTLTVEELTLALKQMKNNKTPGIDGIPADFLKVFWPQLKYFVTRSLNACFKKGKLSHSLRQSVIICIPKGKTNRHLLRNWRPISLLCATYKLASTVIATRMKPFIDQIVSKSQTGFLSGRNIAESTRLVYDLIYLTEERNLDGMLLLVDFAKAFDSISWPFIYNILAYYGFDNSLINWIKLFNNDVVARVSQSGFLSDPIQIQRGCRQGDPISSYLFILGAEVLAILINLSTDITGIIINEKQYRLIQFADDTTLILDGSVRSLQTSLNILEVFGTLSGLKINHDKTKVIWIGKKKRSKEKLNVLVELDWGVDKFKLLGLEFSVNLAAIPEINFNKAISKVNSIIALWKNRSLTPVGKITVVKTLLLPQFNHLFSSILTPTQILDKINNIFFKFVWDGKPDKIRRSTMFMDTKVGGMRMVNIHMFEKSLKLEWIKRIINQNAKNPSPWCDLLIADTGKLDNITNLGPDWCNVLIQRTQNPFWSQIFKYWKDFANKQSPLNNLDIIQAPLWYNSQISKDTLYLTTWRNKGIIMIGDIVHQDGNVLTIQELKDKYSLAINEFDYYRVRALVKAFIKKFKEGSYFAMSRPCLLTHIRVLFQSDKSSRKFYAQQIESTYKDTPLSSSLWNRNLDRNLSKQEWDMVYKACFNVVSDNSVKWFQYRILNNILGTNDQLLKMKLSTNNICRLCNNQIETVQHLMSECSKSGELWSDITVWIKNKMGIDLQLSKEKKVLGYLHLDHHFFPLNFILVHSRKYIFWCAYHNFNLNFFMLQKILKGCFLEEENLAKTNSRIGKFNRIWGAWNQLLLNC